ncbi:MAG TPA: DUF86 domain-containing protein [Candidatus Wallbacteria bacterium]|nr:DUF86 domain-containing protein [Candidatus Wallbacteria bacterium]
MHDKELLKEIFNQILGACERILKKTCNVRDPDFFYSSEENMDKLDAICILLMAIGESIKKIDKITDGKLLLKYPQVDWKGLKGLRDIIGHQYFDINAEAIIQTCNNDITVLKDTIINMLKNI